MAWPLLAVPLITAGASLLGGAMSMAGGAASLAGATLNTAATIGGIASDAAQGVIGAAGGLLGGGKSGNKEETPAGTFRDDQGVLRADGSGANKRGTYASDPKKGMTQAKVKAAIDPTNAEGPVSTLPTGDESDNQILTQILGQIRMNTGILGSMSASLTSMVSSGAAENRTSNIKGQNTDDKKSGNMVSSVFGKLSKGLKKLSGGLGSTGKFLAKGLAIGGLLYFFMKFKDDIRDILAKTFKIGLEFYEGIRDGEITIESIVDAAKTKIKGWTESISEWGKELFVEIGAMGTGFFGWMFNQLKILINDTLNMELFDIAGDAGINEAAEKGMTAVKSVTAFEEKYDKKAADLAAGGSNKEYLAYMEENYGMDKTTALATRKDANVDRKRLLDQMIEISEDSSGRIQWSGMQGLNISHMTKGFSKSMDIARNYNMVLTSPNLNDMNPIIDGVSYDSWSVLDKNSDEYFGGLMKSAGVTTTMGEEKKELAYERLAKKSTIAAQQDIIQDDNMFSDERYYMVNRGMDKNNPDFYMMKNQTTRIRGDKLTVDEQNMIKARALKVQEKGGMADGTRINNLATLETQMLGIDELISNMNLIQPEQLIVAEDTKVLIEAEPMQIAEELKKVFLAPNFGKEVVVSTTNLNDYSNKSSTTQGDILTLTNSSNSEPTQQKLTNLQLAGT